MVRVRVRVRDRVRVRVRVGVRVRVRVSVAATTARTCRSCRLRQSNPLVVPPWKVLVSSAATAAIAWSSSAACKRSSVAAVCIVAKADSVADML